jgi:SAM-dependent methyltransferase
MSSISHAENSVQPILECYGHCSVCSSEVRFSAFDPWLRDNFLCTDCGSIPRERALMLVIETFAPNWRRLAVHESSPSPRGASARLARECISYSTSHYFPDRPLGSVTDGLRCENLEALTFPDDSFDLFVTQDVMEHVFDPMKVFSEIGRVLRPGGMHIFTVPLVNGTNPSSRRARLLDGEIMHISPESYHGSPVGDGRALVTVDWGYDICSYIFQASGLFTHLIKIDDLSRGIRAELIEVLVTTKAHQSTELI